MKAAEKGHERVAEVLIDLNADLNLQNSVSYCYYFTDANDLTIEVFYLQ